MVRLFMRLFVVFCVLLGSSGVPSAAEDTADKKDIFVLPELQIDAERASYNGLISRFQDEITPEMIELKPTRDPVELLRSMNSSVTVSNSLLGSIMTPELRGFDGKHTKVLIDGCPVNTPWNGTSSLSGFPLRRLQKATIAPGGASLIYGSSGMGGAVNLTLPTARDLEGLTFTQEYGGQGTRHQEFIYGNVSHQNEHLFGLFLDNYDGKRRYKNFGTGGNNSDNQMFMYRGRVETDNGWVFKATILKSDGNVSIPNYKERFEPWEMSHRDFVVEKDLGNDSNLVLRYATYRDYSATQFYTDYTLNGASGTVDPSYDVTVEMKTTEALYNFKLGKRHSFTIGGQQQEVKDTGHTVSAKASNKWLTNKGYFISDSIKAGDKLNLHLVARSDESFESDSENSWAFNSDYQITDRANIGFAISKTLRFPNVQELYRASKLYGNENLKPEKADNLEFRLGYQINNRWNASLGRFSSDIENKISLTTTAVAATIPGVGTLKANDNYYVNIAESKIAGWEFAVNGSINENVDAWLSYTRLDRAEDETNGLRIVAKPEFRITAGSIYRKGKNSLMLTCEHQGQTRATSTLDSSGKATAYPKVDASTIFDLGIRRQITNDFALYFNVENLTDVDDAVVMQASDTKNKTGLLMDPIYYRNGRRATMGMEVKF